MIFFILFLQVRVLLVRVLLVRILLIRLLLVQSSPVQSSPWNTVCLRTELQKEITVEVASSKVGSISLFTTG